tara:strand:- start:1628 stop:2305 length:678 start_codon:yes stop_codon:yes gene_type:complete
MLKIAHRGCTLATIPDHRGNDNYYKFPENSLLAYINAIEQNFDMVEADVILTKDDKLIMFHDQYIESTPVNSLTYLEIKNRFKHVITFHVFCSEILSKINVLLDIKGDNNTVFKLIDFFNDNDLDLSRFYFSSFNRNHLLALHNYNKKLKLGIIYDGVLLDIEKEFIISMLKISFVSICWKDLYDNEIKFYNKKNIPIFAWTNINHITRRAIPTNIDGIITDYYF